MKTTINRYDYSLFKDTHPRTGKMGWAAQVLEMPDEFLLKYSWHTFKTDAQETLARYRRKWGQEQITPPVEVDDDRRSLSYDNGEPDDTPL